MTWKCLLIAIILFTQVVDQSSAATTPKSDSTNKITSQSTASTSTSAVVTTLQTTISTTPTSTTPTTTTTTTTAPPSLKLGDTCTNVSECSSTISGSVICQGTCQCDETNNHFEFNKTSCLDASSLTPSVNIFSSSMDSITVVWSHHVPTNSINITYNVTARASMSTTVCQSSSFGAICSSLIPGTMYNISVEAGVEGTIITAVNSTQGATKPAIPGEINRTLSNFNAPNITLEWVPSAGMVELYIVLLQDDTTNINKTANSTTSSIQFYSLPDGRRYRASIHAVSNGLSSDKRIENIQTVVKPPDPPANLSIARVTRNSITIQWHPPSEPRGDLIGYQICWERKVYIDEGFLHDNCTNTSVVTQANISPLTAGTYYKFEIYTINEKFPSVTNATIEDRTVEAEPGKVASLMVTPNNDTLNVTWSRPRQPNGNITSYLLRWEETNGNPGNKGEVYFRSEASDGSHITRLGNNGCPNSTEEIRVNQMNMQYEILHLKAFTNYTVTVWAYTAIGQGQYESKVQQTSLLKPDQVTDVKVSVLNLTAVNISWTIPPRNPGQVNYTIYIFDVIWNQTSNVTPCFQANYTAVECIQEGLQPFWQYRFQVVALNSAGSSPSLETEIITTLEDNPGQVEDALAILFTDDMDCDATKVRVTWTEPKLLDRKSNITHYRILDETGSDKHIFTVPSPNPWSANQRTFSDDVHVEPESTYQWKIQAESRTSLRGFLKDFNFTTKNCRPPVWGDDREEVTSTGVSTNGIRIKIDLTFFKDTSQGRIIHRGFVISRAEDADLTNIQSVGDWRNSSEVYRITVEDVIQDSVSTVPDEVLIGAKDCAASSENFCNTFLQPDTVIYVRGYVCTTGYKCTLTPAFGPFQTAKVKVEEGGPSGGVIAAIVILSILIVFFAIFLVLMFRGVIDPTKWLKRNDEESQHVQMSSLTTSTLSGKRPIPINSYADTLADLHRDTNLKLSDQYEDIGKLSREITEKSTFHAANIEANKPKNRWVNILPYDHSRVKLQQLDDDDPTSDYINANYMPGFNHQREYIASQGPLPGTIDDFWRMVWEQNVKVIVMLTQCREGNRVKCEMYWPDELREPKQYGDIVVNPISISPLDKYNISIFQVRVNGEERQVTHLHYLDFPDFSANVEYDHFLDFVKTARSLVPRENDGPIIVHCSAGVGRTGTFIALDRLQLYLNSPKFSYDGEVDIFNIVISLRENRVSMVQTESQFVLIHDCLLKMLEAKRLREMKSDSDDNLYANQGFDPYPEVLYENINGRDLNGPIKTEL